MEAAAAVDARGRGNYKQRAVARRLLLPHSSCCNDDNQARTQARPTTS
jgi:hypothetical protein